MKTLTKTMQTLPVMIGSLLISVALVACSGDDEPKTHAYDHTHNQATDMEKHPFEHKFAQQCVARETANSVNKDIDRERFAEPCMCIATYMFKDLNAKETAKFLQEHKHTQTMRIKYETAAYNCLQKQQPPKAPKIFEMR